MKMFPELPEVDIPEGVRKALLNEDGSVNGEKFISMMRGRLDQGWAALEEMMSMIGPHDYARMADAADRGSKGLIDETADMMTNGFTPQNIKPGFSKVASDGKVIQRLLCAVLKVGLAEASVRHVDHTFVSNEEDK